MAQYSLRRFHSHSTRRKPLHYGSKLNEIHAVHRHELRSALAKRVMNDLTVRTNKQTEGKGTMARYRSK